MIFFKQIKFLLSPAYKRELVILGVLLLIGMVLEMGGIGVLLPALSFLLSDNTVNTSSGFGYWVAKMGHPSKNAIVLAGLVLLIIFYVIKSLFLIYSSFRQSRFANSLSADLSHDLLSGYMQMPYAFHLQRNSAELQRNIQMEILYFGGISLAALVLATEITTIIGICILLVWIEPIGALSVIVLFGICTYLFNRKTNQRIKNWGYQRQQNDGDAIKHLLEGLGGIKQVKLSHLEAYFLHRFDAPNRNKAKVNTRIQVLNAIPRLYLELLAIVGVAMIIILMMVQSKPLAALIPVLGIFMAAAFRLIPSVNKIINSIQTINFAGSVLDVLTREFGMVRNNKITFVSPTTDKLTFNHSIKVNDLVFSYPESERTALQNVNVSIKKGEFVGIIGSTGSGKSTLIDTVIGLLAPQTGTVQVDGVDINTNISAWQDLIGYVPQTIFLTDDNLRRNIAFGVADNMIDDARVAAVLKTAQLSDFIERLPEGLDTIVGERGVRLSGGERQRIGIARALYNDPPILILDEATSSLDTVTEKEFMGAVNALHGTKTILIVAHRLSTIEKCDRVYELQNGVVIKESLPVLV